MKLTNSKILITGGAGFIGSNLVEYFLKGNNEVVCLDDLSTGHKKNIVPFLDNHNFQFIVGDIRDLLTCRNAVRDCEYVFHEAALGSVPRSIKDPKTTNSVNIDGFLNMLIASRDEGVKRFIYAASSSTYGDSKEMPKIEERYGRPLSPYAITKVVNEYFAKVFSELYGMETIGLRYFNVFGKRQDPNGAYAAVIHLWVKKLIAHESPIVNGDGTYSRDFTYVENVIEANEKAAMIDKEIYFERCKEYFGKDYCNEVVNEVFNVAYGGNTTLNELYEYLNKNLSKFDHEIESVKLVNGPNREGDIPHSLASIEKGKTVLKYNPQYDAKNGFELVCEWYYNNFKK
ncbi:MAG: SDR family oxidoreductase [Melioribacteraceae bacterium]|nr:SDR family oxidoreductase [Melioribacteraceae bacterium]